VDLYAGAAIVLTSFTGAATDTGWTFIPFHARRTNVSGGAGVFIIASRRS